MSDERITPDIAMIAAELNDEFVQRYAEDAMFRREFNAYLRTLGVNVVPDTPPRTLAQLGEDYPTRH
jgi:hypothetical protein